MTSSGEYFRVGPMRCRELEKPFTLPLLLPPFTYNRCFLLLYSLYCAHVVLLASYKDVAEYIRCVCIVVGRATLSVTFAGQPVKGTKRVLTTENKSSFPKIQREIQLTLFHFLYMEDFI